LCLFEDSKKKKKKAYHNCL
jgi:hypothetical protein